MSKSELRELSGVGEVTLERLKDAGVESLEDLSRVSVSDLTDVGMSDNKAGKLIRRANRQAVTMDSGTEVVKERENKFQVTTGLQYLDENLDGGFRGNEIIATAGESGSGKTQIVFNSCVSAVEETGRPAVYIETEPGRYSPKRLQQLSTEEGTQENVFRIEAHTLDQQELAYEKITESDHDFSLVAVDSFTSNFRLSEDYEGRADFSERSTMMARHLNGLRSMAEIKDIPALITAQVYGNPSGFSSPHSVYGGSLFMHTVNYFLMTKKSKGSLRQAKITNHPEVDDSEIHFSISDDGLKSMNDV